jgi:hypothetical protein
VWTARTLALLLVTACAAGCAKTRAAGLAEAPPLAVPSPPPRVLVPAEEEAPLAANPAGPDTSAAVAPRIEPAQQRPARRAPAADAAGEPQPAPAATAAPAPVAETPRELRTAPSSREAAPDERRIQGQIAAAERDLQRVDYRKLPSAGQVEYESSKRFLKEATDALRDGNFLRAQESADKAARIAAALLGAR